MRDGPEVGKPSANLRKKRPVIWRVVSKTGHGSEEGEWWPEASPPGTWKPSPGVGIKISRRAMI